MGKSGIEEWGNQSRDWIIRSGEGGFAMPAAYAHIAVVDCLLPGGVLARIASLTDAMQGGLMESKKYVELGAVSPDYPFLDVGDRNAAGWGNVMHYWKSADFVRRAIPDIVQLIEEDSPEKDHAMAWLFGYVAHVVTDLTVHPIVFLKVGPYEQNKIGHRLCELNQDVYIFPERIGLTISEADILRKKSGGIGACVDAHGRLNPAVADVWKACLSDNTPLGSVDMGERVEKPAAAPDPQEWHERYVAVMGMARRGGHLPVAGRTLEETGLAYPDVADEETYIKNLLTPEKTRIHYNDLFGRALGNVKEHWDRLGEALCKNDPGLFTLANANLDTGRDTSKKTIFWKEPDADA